MDFLRTKRHLGGAVLLLSLTGCFIVAVKHKSVAGGHVVGGPVEYYISSPDSPIEVQRDQAGTPATVNLTLAADSSNGLKMLTYEVSKPVRGGSEYRIVAGDSVSATARTNTEGKKVWSTHLEMPVVLDLGGTSKNAPLRLRVMAEEQNGTRQVIESKYVDVP